MQHTQLCEPHATSVKRPKLRENVQVSHPRSNVVRGALLRVGQGTVGLDPLPQLCNLTTSVRREGKGDQSAGHQVYHRRLGPVEGADYDLADCQTDTVAGHGDCEVVGADVQALGVVKAHRETEQQPGEDDIGLSSIPHRFRSASHSVSYRYLWRSMIGHTDGSVLNDDSECPGRGSRPSAVRARSSASQPVAIGSAAGRPG